MLITCCPVVDVYSHCNGDYNVLIFMSIVCGDALVNENQTLTNDMTQLTDFYTEYQNATLPLLKKVYTYYCSKLWTDRSEQTVRS